MATVVESQGLGSIPVPDQGDSTTAVALEGCLAMDGPMVWEGDRFSSPESYVVRLTPAEITEVDTAVASFEGL